MLLRNFWMVTLALCVVLSTIMATTGVSHAQSLADTDDVLNGTTYLVRADDLILGDPYLASSTETEVEYFALDTDDMVISSGSGKSPKNVEKIACKASSSSNSPFPQQTQPMRMFNLPYDVVVTLAPTSGVASGTGCSDGAANNMTFYVDDPVTGDRHKTEVGSSGIQNGWLHTAVADFDGDGFDDLFINTNSWTYVATAGDTDSPSSGVHIRHGLSTGGALTPMADPTVGDFNADGNLDVAWMGTNFSNGSIPKVHMLTVCAGPVENTICEDADPFTLMLSSATISPVPSSLGSIVTVGGKCTQNNNNQVDKELRAPAMAVAAGQYDGTVGDELLVVSLYEHVSSNNCHILASVYSFTEFAGGSTGANLTPKFVHQLDDIGPHSHMGLPSAIYARAGQLDWSSNKDNVAVAMSSAQNHTVLVISFSASLVMTAKDHKFSTDNNKSFSGLDIGRFSAAPAADTSTSCSQDSDCTDTCKSSVCEISGAACSANGDCTGSCTSDGLCSYITPNQYNLQVAAFLMAHNSDHPSDVYVYTADPINAFTPEKIQEFSVDNFVQPATNRAMRAGSLLRAGDLEGRSQRLGAPSVVRIEGNYQPDLVLSVPPMHADWLSFGALDDPAEFCDPDPEDCPMFFSASNLCNCTDLATNSTCVDGTDVRCLTNFSSLSGTYISQYSLSESDQKQSSTTDTTSWSLGLSVDLSEKTKTLTPTGLELTQEVSFAASNTYDHSVSTTNSSYKTQSFNASTSTGFYDHVWYTARDYNVFYYPVIGQTICVDSCQGSGVCSISGVACEDDSDCPNDFTTCDDADMQQLYVQYSGASSVSSTNADGGGIEWYQPLHEPGQILSYPWDCDELASRNGVNICDESAADYSLLSEADSFSTDTSTQTYTLNWGVGTGSSRTASKGGQFSQSLKETVTASTPALETSPEGAKVKESVSINASESISTARTNSTSLGSSTGITVAHPGTFLTPAKFAYVVDGYIFGQVPTKGTLQQLTPTSAEVQTNGVLRSSFTVDPRTGSSGSWWEAGPYNQFIDVALNRPRHLIPQPGKGASDPSVTQCLPVSQQVAVTDDCVSFDPADPTPLGLWNSSFYWLRGFFVVPADADGNGPQLQQAIEGDVLTLQARVYNYSLQDMAEGEIKVDFYAQEWDATCNAPAGYYDHGQDCTQSGGGLVPCTDICDACCIANEPVPSLQIGQDRLAPLAAFDSQNFPDDANWAVASATFDTGDPSVCGSTGCGDKHFVFWVVTWPELNNSSGDPVLRVELPDHSLTATPGQLTSIADLCPKDNSCINGTCRATQGACTVDSDCPTAADNTCGGDGTCVVSGVACSSDSDCDDCLCEVCIDEFSNNVGFYHQAFFVEPVATEATLTSEEGSGGGVLVGETALERVSIAPVMARPGQKTVVRAGLRALGGRVDGQIVRFRAVPPDAANLTVEEVFEQIGTFDEEILTRIRADRVNEAQVPFFPQELGKYRILVSTLEDGGETLLGTADLDVVDTPPATPTRSVPAATPTMDRPSIVDDSCAISQTTGRASSRTVVLLLAPLFIGLLRFRRRRSATMDRRDTRTRSRLGRRART